MLQIKERLSCRCPEKLLVTNFSSVAHFEGRGGVDQPINSLSTIDAPFPLALPRKTVSIFLIADL